MQVKQQLLWYVVFVGSFARVFSLAAWPVTLAQTTLMPPVNFSTVVYVSSNSPSNPDYHHRTYSFAIIDRETNKTIASQEVSVPPDSIVTELVNLPTTGVAFNKRYAFRALLFSSKTSIPVPTDLIKEEYVALDVDLRKTPISIHMNGYARRGDTVPFTIILLDNYLRPFQTERHASISLWSRTFYTDKEILRKNWTSVVFRPGQAKISGHFVIPTDEAILTDIFTLVVTVDERDQEQKKSNLNVPQSPKILMRYSKPYFFSSATKDINLLNSEASPPSLSPLGVTATIDTDTAVTLASPNVTLKLTFINMYGQPPLDGSSCSIMPSPDWGEYLSGNCSWDTFDRKSKEQTVGNPQMNSFQVNLLHAFPPECSPRDLFATSSIRNVRLDISCTDYATSQTGSTMVEGLKISQNEHVFLKRLLSSKHFLNKENNEQPSFLLVQILNLTGFPVTPLDSSNLRGFNLEIEYFLLDNTTQICDDLVGYNGIVDHQLVQDLSLISRIKLTFRNSSTKFEVFELKLNAQYFNPTGIYFANSPYLFSPKYFKDGRRSFVEMAGPLELMAIGLQNISDLKIGFFAIRGKIEIYTASLSLIEGRSSRNVKYMILTMPFSLPSDRYISIVLMHMNSVFWMEGLTKKTSNNLYRLEIVQKEMEPFTGQRGTVSVSMNNYRNVGNLSQSESVKAVSFGVKTFPADSTDTLKLRDFWTPEFSQQECLLFSEHPCPGISSSDDAENNPVEERNKIPNPEVKNINASLNNELVSSTSNSDGKALQIWIPTHPNGLDLFPNTTWDIPVSSEQGIRLVGFTLDYENGLQVAQGERIVPAWPPLHMRVNITESNTEGLFKVEVGLINYYNITKDVTVHIVSDSGMIGFQDYSNKSIVTEEVSCEPKSFVRKYFTAVAAATTFAEGHSLELNISVSSVDNSFPGRSKRVSFIVGSNKKSTTLGV